MKAKEEGSLGDYVVSSGARVGSSRREEGEEEIDEKGELSLQQMLEAD